MGTRHGDRFSIENRQKGMGTTRHGDRFSIENRQKAWGQEGMGTGFLFRTGAQSPFRHLSGSVLRVSCTSVNSSTGLDVLGNESFHSHSTAGTHFRNASLHAPPWSRRYGRDFSKDSQHPLPLPATLHSGRSLRPGGSPITSFLRSRKTQSPSHSASRIGRAPVVRFGPNRSR